MRRAVITLCAIVAAAACNQPAASPAASTAPAAAKKLGVRPAGDTELEILAIRYR
jgi:streptogramin lyase